MIKHTPGPWEACEPGDYGDFDGNSRVILGDDMRIAVVHWDDGHLRAENDANARLIAVAPDHAMIGWAMCVGSGLWEPCGDGRGEFCINGFRHATRLDEFGVPILTDALRAAIAKARGSALDDARREDDRGEG